MAESELFERGLQRRREVLGSEYVDANFRDSDGFMMVFQRAVTEVGLGLGVEPSRSRHKDEMHDQPRHADGARAIR